MNIFHRVLTRLERILLLVVNHQYHLRPVLIVLEENHRIVDHVVKSYLIMIIMIHLQLLQENVVLHERVLCLVLQKILINSNKMLLQLN